MFLYIFEKRKHSAGDETFFNLGLVCVSFLPFPVLVSLVGSTCILRFFIHVLGKMLCAHPAHCVVGRSARKTSVSVFVSFAGVSPANKNSTPTYPVQDLPLVSFCFCCFLFFGCLFFAVFQCFLFFPSFCLHFLHNLDFMHGTHSA